MKSLSKRTPAVLEERHLISAGLTWSKCAPSHKKMHQFKMINTSLPWNMSPQLYLYPARIRTTEIIFFGLFFTRVFRVIKNITAGMLTQKQEKQEGYCARGISLRLMLNLTRIRLSFFIFNYKVKTKLLSRLWMEGEAAFSCAAVRHCCLAGPGVIVQLEFTSSPLRGGDDSLPQPFRKCGTKKSIFKEVLPHICVS